MVSEIRKQERRMEMMEAGSTGLYWTAGAATLVAVALMLLDITLSFAGGDVATGRLNAVDWFIQLQQNWLMGLRNLGLINVINLTLSIPLYLALFRLHRKGSQALAALALIFVLLGAAVYIANNRALTMLSLSSQYTAATTEAHQSQLAAAGTVVLAQAEDFTPGTFPGFFLSSAGSLLMMVTILRGQVFRRWIGLTGLVGTSCLLVFTISVTFVPAVFQPAMLLAMVGGLLMLTWNVRIAFAMFALGRLHGLRGETEALPASQMISASGVRP